MKHSLAVVFTMWLAATVLADEQGESTTLVIENVTVINVRANSEKEARLEKQWVLIEGDRITQVAPASRVEVQDHVHRIDGSGKYLLPGFWDMHAHVHWPRDDNQRVVLPLMFANGITGLRDMSSDNFPPSKTLAEIRKLQSSIDHGEFLGPRLLALCRRVNGNRQALIRLITIAPHTAAEGREAARLARVAGLDFVKVYSHLTRAAFFGLMDEANRLGLPVAGHLPQAVSPEEASNAGMRCIEHARFPALACGAHYEKWRAAFAAYANRETDKNPRELYLKNLAGVVGDFDEQRCSNILKVFARNGTHLCPTHTTRKMDAMASDPTYRSDPRRKYITSHRLIQWDRDLNATAAASSERISYFKKFYQLGLRVTGLAHRQGVRILAGTDSYDTHVFPGFSYHDELEHLHQAGLTPLEVLKAATIRPAEFLEKADSFGTVERDKFADLVLLNDDPLVNISNTRLIHAVVFNGKVHPHAELQEMIRRVEQYTVTSESPQESLWNAVMRSDLQQALTALKNGADVNALDTRRDAAGQNGRRALNYAASRNDAKMIEALLNAGAKVNLTNRTGFTALHHAAEYGAANAAQLLLSNGADPKLKNRRGLSALEIANVRGKEKTAEIIRKAITGEK